MRFCHSTVQKRGCKIILALFQETTLAFHVQRKSISLVSEVNTTTAAKCSVAQNISFISAECNPFVCIIDDLCY